MGIIDKCGVRGDATLCVGIFKTVSLENFTMIEVQSVYKSQVLQISKYVFLNCFIVITELNLVV